VNYCYVLNVMPGSSAEEAGLQPKDKIVAFNGVKLFSREQFTDLVNRAADQKSPITIERKGEQLNLQVTPRYNEKEKRALIGIVFNTFDVKKPWAQIKSHSMLIVRLLQALVTPKEAKNAAGAVGGPVAIFQMFWLYVQMGLIAALWFTGLLNVNLAILNLLPLPVLDGGHIMFSLWEWITGKPVHERVVEWLVNIFATLLIVLFVFLTYRDVVRWGAFRAMRKEAMEKAAPAATNQPPAVTNQIPPAEAVPTK
jgi:regulator of sigma E protease